jgi:hypothetical protein
LNLNVLPVRVFDDPAQSDPDANVTAVAGGWNVVLNFLLQYGAPNYTVELDGDWGAAWNDGTAGRIYAVPGSPFAAAGLKSATVNILSAGQPAGNYTFALRVTDGAGAQYIYVWPTAVNLPGVATWNLTVASAITVHEDSRLSQKVVNGNPAITWSGGPGEDLVYVRASDALGSGWNAAVTVYSSAGRDGYFSSLEVVNNRPAVSYIDLYTTGDRTCYVRSSDINGAGWPAPNVLDAVSSRDTSMTIVNNRPAIAYMHYGFGTNDLVYNRATDANGNVWGAPMLLDGTLPGDSTGYWPSLCVVNGNPAIGYSNSSPPDGMKYIRASDLNGAAWGAPIYLALVGVDATGACLQVVTGNPAVSFVSPFGTKRLNYMRSNDVNGGAWGASQVVGGARMTQPTTSMAVVGGFPCIAYYDTFDRDLVFVSATTANGSAWGAPVVVDWSGDVGSGACLKDVAGNPGIAYFDLTNNRLKYAHFH